jgi:hypothetical protein
MTKDDIIKLALEAGLYTILNEHAHEYGNGYFEITPYPELERFAALVRADEREVCAALLEDNAMHCTHPLFRSLLQANAAAIRAMGKT